MSEFLTRIQATFPLRLLADLVGPVSIGKMTTLKAGGMGWILRPRNVSDLAEAIACSRRADLPVYPLGRGSNLIVADGDLSVLFIQMPSEGEPTADAEGLVTASADTFLPGLLSWCHRQGLLGFEWAAGIPGTLGGAVAMNAGTKLGDLAMSLAHAEVVDERGPRNATARDLDLSYRHSNLTPGSLVTRVVLRLTPSRPEAVDAARESVKQYIQLRNRTQPLDQPSFGSTFANPPGDAAARLIESCGLKGKTRGGMMVSPRHANFTVNLGNGTARDAVDLVREVREVVARTTGVVLRTEVRTAGFPSDPLAL